MSALKFVCPECGETGIDEVVLNCTVYNWVEIGPDGGYEEMLDSMIEGGDTPAYQCHACGHEIKWPDGSPIIDTEELAEYLLEQDYNKE